MALFSRRERIAIACIGVLIFTGWGVRFWMHNNQDKSDIRIIRNAVEPPPFFSGKGEHTDSINVYSQVPVNINTAGAEELGELPMIGPTRAAAIVAYRAAHGPFLRSEDIMHVPGIGAGIYRSIADRITVGDSTAVKPEGP